MMENEDGELLGSCHDYRREQRLSLKVKAVVRQPPRREKRKPKQTYARVNIFGETVAS